MTGNPLAHSVPAMAKLGERIREEREKRQWSQDRLAREAGTSQTTIDNVEKGTSKRSRYLVDILRVLGLPLDLIESPLTQTSPTRIVNDPYPDTGTKLPIYASAQGGEGQMVTDFRPIDRMVAPEPLHNVPGAYGIYVTGSSMEPRYFEGEVALVHPYRPPRAGDDVLLVREEHGISYCMIKHLRATNSRVWRLTQFNPPPGEPKDFDVPKADWPKCLYVAGRITR